MSIKVSSAVWGLSEMKGSALLLLLAIADNASDEGFAWPGLELLAKKTRMSRRQTIRLVQEIEEFGELIVIKGKKYNRYLINVWDYEDKKKCQICWKRKTDTDVLLEHFVCPSSYIGKKINQSISVCAKCSSEIHKVFSEWNLTEAIENNSIGDILSPIVDIADNDCGDNNIETETIGDKMSPIASDDNEKLETIGDIFEATCDISRTSCDITVSPESSLKPINLNDLTNLNKYMQSSEAALRDPTSQPLKLPLEPLPISASLELLNSPTCEKNHTVQVPLFGQSEALKPNMGFMAVAKQLAQLSDNSAVIGKKTAKPPTWPRDELMMEFTRLTKLGPAKNSSPGNLKLIQKRWWMPLQEIYELSNDLDISKSIIKQAISEMTKANLTFSCPASILENTRDAWRRRQILPVSHIVSTGKTGLRY